MPNKSVYVAVLIHSFLIRRKYYRNMIVNVSISPKYSCLIEGTVLSSLLTWC